MRKILRNYLFVLWSVFFISCNVDSCCNTEDSGKTGFKLVCWNVQTFFDAYTSGCEYSEFKNSENWNEERYKIRLQRLCEFIKTTDADVYVFEELENSGILYDIYNQLCGDSWNSKKLLSYGAFSKEPDAAIGVGVLSKLPLEDVKMHDMDIRVQKEKQPSGRPILEVNVVSGNKSVRLLVNHWKSKASGAGNGEIWRQWQEAVLTNQLLSAPSESTLQTTQGFIACGDFNKDVSAFVSVQNSGLCEIHLRGITSPWGVLDYVNVKSPWLREDGSLAGRNGSYYYKENWERIDNIFYNNGVEISGFRVPDEEPWATEEGIPNGYKVYSGEGYSDHLPLICNVFF